MHCTQCGAAVPDGARFCATCGANTIATTPAVVRTRPVAVTLLAVLKIFTSLGWLLIALLFTFAWGGPAKEPAFGVIGAVFLAISLLAALCAYGLWTLKPWGRFLQIAFSCLGLIVGFPIGTVISILILIYMFQPGVRLLFSGRPIESLSAAEAHQLLALSKSGMATAVVVAAVGAFLFVPLAGIMAAIAIPNLLNAIDRGKQKRTMIDIRSIGTAMEAYRLDRNAYPVAETIGDLSAALSPVYVKAMPTTDGWQHPLQVQVTDEHYLIYSFGKDGTGTSCEDGETTAFVDQICFVDGDFVRYPSGSQR
ncbi:MAG TPA: type II secretion system protein GspG [Candidatus Polarisedimenticolaceae bacterium]|nr:type II secretion system protein GspG [Candidatus Polarisedimenticolaceae bacterium]